jgi:2-keto-4-pentenoate hydratase/2-oxohepta-3-ene-1,7-dioic acid hydratase in catechol pathway
VLLPYGVDTDGHVVVAAGREVIDLSLMDGFDVDRQVFRSGSLNQFIALGPDAWARTRAQLLAALGDDSRPSVAARRAAPQVQAGAGHESQPAVPAAARRATSDVVLIRPWTVGDYADFYASREHVEAMGRMLRPGEDPLPPAWLHLPIGYHGRAGTVIVSGQPVYRPWGIRPGPSAPEPAGSTGIAPAATAGGTGIHPASPGGTGLASATSAGGTGIAPATSAGGTGIAPATPPSAVPAGGAGSAAAPSYGPSLRLDVEVELGFVVGVGVDRGQTITAAEAERHLFGMVVLNDWSARDIQAFEYRPLGPFLGKSFATSISPWVVPMAALEPYRAAGPVQDPEPASYLKASEPRGFDIRLQLCVNDSVISRMSSSGLYWSPAQMLAHLTANGAGVRAGDLFGTGTISGPGPGASGSLMEHWQGERWLTDGDQVTMSAWCGDEPAGTVTGRVEARP